MATTIIDIGIGNTKSISNALNYIGEPSITTNNFSDIETSETIILPGVGAFNSAIQEMKKLQIDTAIHSAINSGAKILGICLGFQLLFSSSEENGYSEGLNLIDGAVKKLPADNLNTPHIGFEETYIVTNAGIFNEMRDSVDFYYVHSYCVQSTNTRLDAEAYCTYGEKFLAAFQKENIYGCQFHPEKSQKNGLRILKNFLKG